MREIRRTIVLATLVALVASACTGGGNEQKTGPEVSVRGGTLRVGLVNPPTFPAGPLWIALDPQQQYSNSAWELFRCCLVRTLLSYNGGPTEEGGAELHPDLAASMPEVSATGLTWTFRLKAGLHYAPPFDRTEITSQDIVRALLRMGNPKAVPDELGSYPFYYSVIRGFDEYRVGKSETISGLETPDPLTLVAHLRRSVGDFGYVMALPAAGPIPPSPRNPSAPFGAATGHDRFYGRFLVASGPYMLEGSEKLDFSLAPREQRPVAGHVPGRSITLVRNPSWSPARDPLRSAYADRIEISIGGTGDELDERVESGRLDLVLDRGPSLEVFRRYTSDKDLADRVFVGQADEIFYLSMNLAVPPFDDVNIRRAVNLAIDKAELVRRTEEATNLLYNVNNGPMVADVATHAGLDSEEANLLSEFDPYRTSGHRGDLARARAEMSRSGYDRDHNGVCDAPACLGVLALINGGAVPSEGGELVKRNLQGIGIDLEVEVAQSFDDFFAKLGDPAQKVPLAIGAGLLKDYPNASTTLPPAFGSSSVGSGCCNWALLGATPRQLREWGYSVTQVPTVDDRIDACIPLVGAPQAQCWAALDQYVMDEVVPWVPYLTILSVRIVSARVARFSSDQFTTLPALDQIALRR